MKKKILGLSALLFVALINCVYVSKSNAAIGLDMDTVECLAAPEWSSEYKYQAYGYCGPSTIGYKCVICKTGEYCSRYKCLADCN